MSEHVLQTTTHRSPEWWVATIQQLVADASTPNPDDPNHDTTDAAAWLKRVVDLAVASLPPDGQYDGNMRAASIVAQALLVWYVRLHRAKFSDPRRPLELRQRSYKGWLAQVRSIFDTVVDVRSDPVHFPGQEWENPFSPTGRNGAFV